MRAWKGDIIRYTYKDGGNTDIEDKWNYSAIAMILVQMFFLMAGQTSKILINKQYLCFNESVLKLLERWD